MNGVCGNKELITVHGGVRLTGLQIKTIVFQNILPDIEFIYGSSFYYKKISCKIFTACVQ